ncbi:hypothetical protein [Nostoc sp.]
MKILNIFVASIVIATSQILIMSLSSGQTSNFSCENLSRNGLDRNSSDCFVNEPTNNNTISNFNTATEEEEGEQIKPKLIGMYSDTYCGVMKAGLNSDQAKSFAVTEVSSVLFKAYDMTPQSVNKYMGISFFERAAQEIETKCPKYSRVFYSPRD